MSEHGALAGLMARVFGNAAFQAPEPRPLMLYLIDNNDRGWFPFDEHPGRDPDTGLPWNLVQTPKDITLQTLAAGPAYNEAHDPYCGLLVTMQTYVSAKREQAKSKRQVSRRNAP